MVKRGHLQVVGADDFRQLAIRLQLDLVLNPLGVVLVLIKVLDKARAMEQTQDLHAEANGEEWHVAIHNALQQF